MDLKGVGERLAARKQELLSKMKMAG